VQCLVGDAEVAGELLDRLFTQPRLTPPPARGTLPGIVWPSWTPRWASISPQCRCPEKRGRLTFAVFLIIIGPWPVKILGLILLALDGYAFIGWRVVSQEVRLEPNQLVLQLGIGPAFRVAYGDIVDVREATPDLGRFGRAINSIAGYHSGYKPFGWPYVRIYLNHRRLRVTWLLPMITYARTAVLPVWQTDELVEEVQSRIPNGYDSNP